MRISYAVENLRCLKEMELVELKPITVLLGANNSGKSSFLKTFPLLRRSIEFSTVSRTRSRSPIFWKEDSDIADFNDFNTTVRNRKEGEEITFSFKIQDLKVNDSNSRIESNNADAQISSKVFKSIILKISLCFQNDSTVISNISYEIPEYDIVFTINNHDSNSNNIHNNNHFLKDVEFNNFDLNSIFKNARLFISSNMMFSLIEGLRTEYSYDKKQNLTHEIFSIWNDVGAFVFKKIDQYKIKNANPTNICIEILKNTRLTNEIIKKNMNETDKTTKKFYEKILCEDGSDSIKYLDSLCTLKWVMDSYDKVVEILRVFFLSSTYLGPYKVGSKRIYSQKELDVSEISPDGQNLGMFLKSIESKEKNLEEFSSWTKKFLDLNISMDSSLNGVSIMVDRNGFKVNVADAGSGVSQVLPVIAQIWESSRNFSHSSIVGSEVYTEIDEYSRPIAIEQPETHLHPRHQAMIADAIHLAISETRDSNVKPIYIIETHSKPFIQRLGELVEYEGLSRGDIQIINFSNDLENDFTTQVSTSYFSEEGYLKNWPVGFFGY